MLCCSQNHRRWFIHCCHDTNRAKSALINLKRRLDLVMFNITMGYKLSPYLAEAMPLLFSINLTYHLATYLMYTSSNKRIPNVNSAITRNGQIDIVHKVDTRNRFFMHVISPLGAYGGCAIALAAKRPDFDCFVSTSRKKRIFIVQNKDRFNTCCMSLKENTNGRFCMP